MQLARVNDPHALRDELRRAAVFGEQYLTMNQRGGPVVRMYERFGLVMIARTDGNSYGYSSPVQEAAVATASGWQFYLRAETLEALCEAVAEPWSIESDEAGNVIITSDSVTACLPQIEVTAKARAAFRRCDVGGEPAVTVPAAEFESALATAVAHVGEDHRAIAGYVILTEGDDLSVRSTDGRRLAEEVVLAAAKLEPPVPFQRLLRGDIAQRLLDLEFDTEGAFVELFAPEPCVLRFGLPHFRTAWARQFHNVEDFPDLDAAFPAGLPDQQISLPAAALKSAACAAEAARALFDLDAVELTASAKGLFLGAKGERGGIEICLDLAPREEMTVRVNACYLAAALEGLEATVRLGLFQGLRPIVIQDATDARRRRLVMPCRAAA